MSENLDLHTVTANEKEIHQQKWCVHGLSIFVLTMIIQDFMWISYRNHVFSDK